MTADTAISGELMATFADCARTDFKACIEMYCAAISQGRRNELARQARDDLAKARDMMDLTRSAEYY